MEQRERESKREKWMIAKERILLSWEEKGDSRMPWMMGKEYFPSVRSSQKLLFSVYWKGGREIPPDVTSGQENLFRALHQHI